MPHKPQVKRPALQPLLRRWQRALRLLDWQLKVQYVRKFPDGKEAYGQCRCKQHQGSAEILIMDPTVDQHDVERTLVHELLHVKLWDIVRDSKHILPLEERFIEHLVPLLCRSSK